MTPKRSGGRGARTSNSARRLPRRRSAILAETRQMEALVSPRRLELVQAFDPGEECTALELAARVGRPPDRIYYHLKQLVACGVLVESGRRKSGQRWEVLYRTVADRLVLPHEPGSAQRFRATERMVGSLLRTAAREFRRHLASAGTVPLPKGAPPPSARRYKGWLTPSDVRRLHEYLTGIESIFLKRRTSRAGILTVLTAIVVPEAATRPPGRGTRVSSAESG